MKIAELEQELRKLDEEIVELKKEKYKNGKNMDKLSQRIRADETDLPKKRKDWHEKMRCFFKSFIWNILKKFEESGCSTLAMPPIAMDMHTEEVFTPQVIANLMLSILQDYLISKLRF